jgi:GH24 family phage-related lysozyme (muramidase)
LNARDYEGASLEFNGWDKDNGVTLRGLTKRRAMERALFLKGDK